VIGIVTSSEGAALRDVCTVIRRRAPSTVVWLKAVPVQGREAAPEIARAIRWFAARSEVEVLIVGRGGGSIEDLWAFNEEIVVRAIVESPIPVISAVGHETDTTLADFAADLRAPTPSAAAEHAVPDARGIARTLVGCFRRLSAAMERQRLRRIEAALAPIQRYGFRRVRDRLREDRQRWAESVEAVPATLAGRLDARRLELRDATGGLAARPAAALAGTRRGLERSRGLAREVARRHERVRTRAEHLGERLQAASPLAILARGYAVVRGPGGAAVTDASTLAPGDSIDVRLSRGRAAARVTHTEPEEKA
jgi:exodeoxyribonuclease VII large subunit